MQDALRLLREAFDAGQHEARIEVAEILLRNDLAGRRKIFQDMSKKVTLGRLYGWPS
ncbi:hypothetical protein [Embleya sp. NPDC005575]|uniref:hypothetical protein n=1 Tax=Embleya sp. NPDC005575 TaxID=3156892 RepID=UPI0033A904F9